MLTKFIQSLPPFKGKNRMARWLLSKTIRDKKDMIVEGDHNLRYKIPNFIEPIGFNILIHGSYEKETTDFIIDLIPAGGVFLDIGANIGSISIPICRQRSDIKAIGVEASPRVYRYLSGNLQLNNITNCTIVNNAIDEVDGRKVNFYSEPERYGTGSMSAVFTTEAEQIDTVSIDTLVKNAGIKKVDFIKIDIEGYEYYAFKGARQVLEGDEAPDILFEFVDWAEKQARGLKPGDAQELLISMGFNLYEFRDGKVLPLRQPLQREGWIMLYATKKKISRQK